jgi:low affinity Fe/Cu permease
MVEALQRALTLLGTFTARPSALLIVLAYAVFWLFFERESFDLHAVATLMVWVMTLLIQRSEHRDTQAIHAKLDELLRADDAASSDLARIDGEEPEAIERSRAETQAWGDGS